MSYLSQMAGLAVQNFVSAGVGMAVSWPSSAASPAARQGRSGTSGRTSTARCVHPAPALDRPRADPRRPGRRPDLLRPCDRHDPRGRAAVDRARPGRLADRHQAARNERRRLLQLELGSSLREPDCPLELPRDAVDPPDPGGPDVHVRTDGRLCKAGLGDLRGHVRDVRIGVAIALPSEQHGSQVLRDSG